MEYRKQFWFPSDGIQCADHLQTAMERQQVTTHFSIINHQPFIAAISDKSYHWTLIWLMTLMPDQSQLSVKAILICKGLPPSYIILCFYVNSKWLLSSWPSLQIHPSSHFLVIGFLMNRSAESLWLIHLYSDWFRTSLKWTSIRISQAIIALYHLSHPPLYLYTSLSKYPYTPQ